LTDLLAEGFIMDVHVDLAALIGRVSAANGSACGEVSLLARAEVVVEQEKYRQDKMTAGVSMAMRRRTLVTRPTPVTQTRTRKKRHPHPNLHLYARLLSVHAEHTSLSYLNKTGVPYESGPPRSRPFWQFMVLLVITYVGPLIWLSSA
jgi:hypothetical protein